MRHFLDINATDPADLRTMLDEAHRIKAGRGDAAKGVPDDEQALAGLLQHAETEPAFLESLKAQVGNLAKRFLPEKEQASLEQALRLAMQRCSQGR